MMNCSNLPVKGNEWTSRNK